MLQVVYVGIGGFAGASARYLVYHIIARSGASSLAGTLAVNITGSLLLAILGVWVQRHAPVSERVVLLIGTGFFGSFTTFSTYANETAALFTNQDWRASLAYIVGMNALCLLAVAVGLALAHRLWPTH